MERKRYKFIKTYDGNIYDFCFSFNYSQIDKDIRNIRMKKTVDALGHQ